jgi:lysophospholipase L1-like esterase
MLDCLIIGDSIAKGVADIRRDCAAYAEVGINSHDWYKKYYNKPLVANNVVISLGSNDTKGIRTRDELHSIRQNVDPEARVLWILPYIDKPWIRDAIMLIADNYGDDVLEIRESADGVHPTARGYRSIAKQF